VKGGGAEQITFSKGGLLLGTKANSLNAGREGGGGHRCGGGHLIGERPATRKGPISVLKKWGDAGWDWGNLEEVKEATGRLNQSPQASMEV